MTTTNAVLYETRMVPLAKLAPSKTNPRKHFDPKALADLQSSIADKGIITPLLVRPVGDGFEIVAGERRYRAAKALKETEVPCNVRQLDDQQALEVQVIENLQRADVHPLEEAEGYRQLLERGKYDLRALTARVGKSDKYVAQRLKLLDLTDPVRKAFLEEEITVGHAMLIARLQPKLQKQALDCALDWSGALLSVKRFEQEIHRQFHLDLSKVRWDIADPKLVPAAGACTTCPKRTGNNPALFAEVPQGDTCTDSACFEKKAAAFVQIQIAAHPKATPIATVFGYSLNDQKQWPKGTLTRSEYQTGKKCPHSQDGLVVAADKNEELGKVVSICRTKRCKIHYQPSSSPPRPTKPAVDKKREENQAIESRFRLLTLKAVAAAAEKEQFDEEQLRSLARQSLDFMGDGGEVELVAEIAGVERGKASAWNFTRLIEKKLPSLGVGKLRAIIVVGSLSDQLDYFSRSKLLLGAAKRYRINTAPLKKQAAAEIAQKKNEKTKPKKAA